VFDEPPLVQAVHAEKDADGVARRLRRLGIDAVLINIQEGLRVGSTYPWYKLDQADWGKLDEFFWKYTDLAGASNLAQLYRLRSTPLAQRPERPASNTIVFLDPAACDYVKAMRSGDMEKRTEALADLCSRQTFTPQWWLETAELRSQEGKNAEALEAWKKAAGLGILPKEQYQAWAQEAKMSDRQADVAEALKQERRWYGSAP
jgi:hypothetical protein